MAITVTGRGTTTAVNPPEVLSLASAAFSPTASRLIVSLDSGFLGYQAGVGISTTDNIADTGGGAWVQDAYVDIQASAEGFVRLAHRQLGTAPGASKTVTIQNSGIHHDVWVHNVLEVAGHNTTTPVPTGQHAIGNSTSSTVSATLPVAPASTSLVVCGVCAPNGPTLATPTGFTVVTNTVLTGDGHGHYYKIGSGPQTVSWTGLTAGGAGYSNLCYIVEIAQASGGGSGPADPGFSLTDTFGDAGGGAWTKVTGVTGLGGEVDIFYRRIGTFSGTQTPGAVTATSANSTQGRSVSVTEMAGRNTDNPVPPGQTATMSVTTATGNTTLPATPSTDSVLISGVVSLADASAPGVPAGHTALTNQSTGGDGYEASYKGGNALAVVAYTGLATTSNLAASAEIRALGSGSGGGGGGQYFTSNSTWNTPIPAGANFTDEPSLRSGGGWFNADAYGTPFLRSATTDRLVTMSYPNNSWGWAGSSVQLRIPDNAYGATGTDGSLSILDPSTNLAHDFWQFTRPSGTSSTGSCSAYARSNVVTEDGWSSAPGRGAGIHASGSALIAGAILGNELTQGINHTLAVAIRDNLCTGSYIFPSINADGGGGAIPNGQRLGIPPGVAMPGGMSIQGQNIWKAMQKYGGYVIDTASGSQSVFWWGDTLSVPAADITALLNPPTYNTVDLNQTVNALRIVH